MFGPAEAAHLGRVTGKLIGAQLYRETADLLGVNGDDPASFGAWMAGMAAGEGDTASVKPSAHDGNVIVARATWRLMRGLGPLSPAIFEAWNGLFEGALAVHNRFLVLEVRERLDYGDRQFVWHLRMAR